MNAIASSKSSSAPGGWTLALWLFPVLLTLECCFRPIAEPDLFFYFALIEHYFRTGVWAVTDPFLYTLPNDTLVSLHQWLGYWAFYWPYQVCGWAGPILLKTVLVTLFLFLPLWPMLKDKKVLPTYFPLAWTIAIFIAHHRFRERVSLFGDLSVLALVVGLLWGSHKRWFWWGLPLLFWLWAQMHPSYPLGWVILLVSFALRPARSWNRLEGFSLLLCLLVPLLNPLGLSGVIYPFSFALNIEPYLRQYVVEWLPLTDSRLFEFRFLYVPFFTFVPFVAWRLWRQRAEAKGFEWFLFVLALALTVKSVRFGLIAEGLYLTLLTKLEWRRPLMARAWLRSRTVVALTTLACLGLVTLKVVLSPNLKLSLAERMAIDTGYFPEKAVDELTLSHPQLHIFNSFGFGGYLAWRWHGEPRIFFHGFSTNFKFYEENYNRPQESQVELDKVIDRFDIGIFLLSKLGNDNNFIELLAQHPGWQKIREDQASVIFAKRDRRVFP